MVQLQILNKLLDNKDSSFLLVNNIDKTFFSDYEEEFEFIKNHLDGYGVIPDKISFLDKFPHFDIIEVNEPTDYLLDKLYDDKNQRTLATIFNKIRDSINSGNIEEAMGIYSSSYGEVVKAKHLDCVDILHDTSRYDKYIEKCNDYNKYYISTGFRELDELIGGWDRNEELVTIVARPGVGKSWVLLKTAVASAKQGLNVGIYSGEMSEDKVGYRIDTLISNISNTKIMRGNETIQVEYKKYLDNLSNNISGSIKVLTPSMINGTAGVTSLRAFIEKENLDILFVDQHSLLEDDRKARNPVERASNISKDLKNLQVLKKIPIVSVSQQNRESTDNGVGTNHIAQSDRISQDSTILIFLEHKDNVLSLNLVKARDSVNGKVLKYAIDLDKGIFTFIPESQDESKSQELHDEYEYDEGEEIF